MIKHEATIHASEITNTINTIMWSQNTTISSCNVIKANLTLERKEIQKMPSKKGIFHASKNYGNSKTKLCKSSL